MASDVGQPISDFATKLKYDRLVQDAKEVLDTLLPKDSQVQASDGRWYDMRVLPYRTADNVIDGVVMTFADITAIKQLEESLTHQQEAMRQQQVELQAAREFAESIIATTGNPCMRWSRASPPKAARDEGDFAVRQ